MLKILLLCSKHEQHKNFSEGPSSTQIFTTDIYKEKERENNDTNKYCK